MKKKTNKRVKKTLLKFVFEIAIILLHKSAWFLDKPERTSKYQNQTTQKSLTLNAKFLVSEKLQFTQ